MNTKKRMNEYTLSEEQLYEGGEEKASAERSNEEEKL